GLVVRCGWRFHSCRSLVHTPRRNSITACYALQPRKFQGRPLLRLGLFAGHRRDAWRHVSPRRQRRENGRQLDTENRPASLTVVAKDFPTMLLHDPVADAQSKSSALSDRLRRVKRVKHAMRLLDAGAGIGEKNYHVAAVPQGLDAQEAAAAIGHGV